MSSLSKSIFITIIALRDTRLSAAYEVVTRRPTGSHHLLFTSLAKEASSAKPATAAHILTVWRRTISHSVQGRTRADVGTEGNQEWWEAGLAVTSRLGGPLFLQENVIGSLE